MKPFPRYSFHLCYLLWLLHLVAMELQSVSSLRLRNAFNSNLCWFSKHSLEDLKEAMEDFAEQRKEDIVDSVDVMDWICS